MILPNKLIPFNKCVLSKVVSILKELEISKKPCGEIFISTRPYFEDVNEYILALDVLYVLGKIGMDEKGVLESYAKKN